MDAKEPEGEEEEEEGEGDFEEEEGDGDFGRGGDDDGGRPSERTTRGGRRAEGDREPAPRYLGTRRDREGKWVRRHYSHARFPKLAAKASGRSTSRSRDGPAAALDRSTSRLRDGGGRRGERRRSRCGGRASAEGSAGRPSAPRDGRGGGRRLRGGSLSSAEGSRGDGKIRISRGRRALLRVSERAYSERHRSRFAPSSPEPERELEYEWDPDRFVADDYFADGQHTGELCVPNDMIGINPCQEGGEGEGEEDEGVNYEWMMHDQERIRRFEEAFNAILHATKSRRRQEDDVSASAKWLEAGGKKWTRGDHVVSAISIDGRRYEDLQRTPTISLKQMMDAARAGRKGKHDAYLEELRRCDPEAPWMVHIPGGKGRRRRDGGGKADFLAHDGPGVRKEERNESSLDGTTRPFPHNLGSALSPLEARAHTNYADLTPGRSTGESLDHSTMEADPRGGALPRKRLDWRPVQTWDDPGEVIGEDEDVDHVEDIAASRSKSARRSPRAVDLRGHIMDGAGDAGPSEEGGDDGPRHSSGMHEGLGGGHASSDPRPRPEGSASTAREARTGRGGGGASTASSWTSDVPTREHWRQLRRQWAQSGVLPGGGDGPTSKASATAKVSGARKNECNEGQGGEVDEGGGDDRPRRSNSSERKGAGGGNVSLHPRPRRERSPSTARGAQSGRGGGGASTASSWASDVPTREHWRQLRRQWAQSGVGLTSKASGSGDAGARKDERGVGRGRGDEGGGALGAEGAKSAPHVAPPAGGAGSPREAYLVACNKKTSDDAPSVGATTKTTESTASLDHSEHIPDEDGRQSGGFRGKGESIQQRVQLFSGGVGTPPLSPRTPQSPARGGVTPSGASLKAQCAAGSSSGDVPPPSGDRSGGRAEAPPSVHSRDDSSGRTPVSYGDGLPLNFAAILKESLLSHASDSSIIDTDGTEVTFEEGHYERKMRSLLLSPALITKRYRQALDSIESRRWDQFAYLVTANPWLMEMKDVRNDRSLVHSLALFGGGRPDRPEEEDGGEEEDDDALDDDGGYRPVPRRLACAILDYDPTVAHKLDSEGNLPLHMAAASGNSVLIAELVRRFPGAASVRNHDGMLPLHLAIEACALFPGGRRGTVGPILRSFPNAARVGDREGNAALHVAAGVLEGDVGADVMRTLLKYAPEGASLLEATNKAGETPLARAIKSAARATVVCVLLETEAGKAAAFLKDAASRNALHLALDPRHYDPEVVLAVLKAVPGVATAGDGNGALPIRLACASAAHKEIVFALAVVDLPIDLEATERVTVRTGYGSSWRSLLRESGDLPAVVVRDILSLCSFPQRVALCLAGAGDDRGDGLIAVAQASSRCKLELNRGIRRFGRFELVGEDGTTSRPLRRRMRELEKFVRRADANATKQEVDKVNVVCYADPDSYQADAHHLQSVILDPDIFEDLSFFSVEGLEPSVPSRLLCLAVEEPDLSLSSVVSGMRKHHKKKSDSKTWGRYFGKCRSILRRVAKALARLHANDIVHGAVDANRVGKFGDKWKLTGLLGSSCIGERFATERIGAHSPPEAFRLGGRSRKTIASSTRSVRADPAADIWAYGKLAYEVLARESPFAFCPESLSVPERILSWDEERVYGASETLKGCRVGPSGVDLILGCLHPDPSRRTPSIQDVLRHPFWRDENAFDLT
ncbi:hypothetical protein ACHAWF_013124 [Thalassiosira exigua]